MGAEEVLTTSQVGASQVTTSEGKEDWEQDGGGGRGNGTRTRAKKKKKIPASSYHVRAMKWIVHPQHAVESRAVMCYLSGRHSL